jgi:hypothetical protein
MSYLFDPFNNNAQTQAANAQIAGINAGVGAATPYYNQGISALENAFSSAKNPLQQNFMASKQGLTALGNSLGFGGPAGNAAAVAAFQNNPGYQFQLQQGDNAILAAQAAGQGGGLASGNTLVDLSKFNQGLANTSWNQYISNLQPYINFAQNSGQGLSNVSQNLGTQLNAAYGNLGNMAYGANTSIGNANANADLGNLTGASNVWNLGANLAGGLMKFSDEAVKEDIEPVGALADGQTVYRYRYIGDPVTHIGLIAQEVEGHAPEAVDELLPGIRGVDYHRATNRASELMKLVANDDKPSIASRYTNELMRMAA